MATDLVTFKMEHDFLEDVDKVARVSGFQNRTEFIRNALREKVQELKLNQAMIALSQYRGKSNITTTQKDREQARELAFDELEKELIKKNQ